MHINLLKLEGERRWSFKYGAKSEAFSLFVIPNVKGVNMNIAANFSVNTLLKVLSGAIYVLIVFTLTSCIGQKSIVADTPELAAKENLEAFQKLDIDTLSQLTCAEYRPEINKYMIDNGAGREFGFYLDSQGDMSELTYTTIFINPDNDIAHVHITGNIRYTEPDQVFTIDTVWLMEKNENVWQECGIVNQ